VSGITVFFGVFGHRWYRRFTIVDVDMGAAQIPCRWCVGDGHPASVGCRACKGTGRMWISV